ncbi:MAG: glycerol-3-phosphate dehydrogenase/oxidase [Planctomycetota bacterium]|nr:glycerol-3-phosphate dehydrogenase/oxidase [Planctomycetota bacterium]
MNSATRPVLILGAGVNGAALARELLLNRVPVVLVDTADICSGASAYSSRLIHGGLRYLEFGEFDLVRESLDERKRLLQLAPQYVRPLRLFIPARRRLGGMWPTLARFVFGRSAPTRQPRGMWLVRSGLWLYDRYAADRQLPPHAVHRAGDAEVPSVDGGKYRWLCSYWDAQIAYPERFVVAMLQDTGQLATDDCPFRLLTYHRAQLDGQRADIFRLPDQQRIDSFQPLAIVNATGAWVDLTLEKLPVTADRLMGGTRGSHFISYHQGLRAALGEAGIYVEAADGRPVFVLPLGGGVLVGTTDVPFEGDPATARATDDEIHYLLKTVNDLLPDVRLSAADVAAHYSGVRPLPYTRGLAAAAITRRHQVHRHTNCPLPVFSLIGGKLTTCRALAEQTARTVLDELDIPVTANSRDRPLPGADGYPTAANEPAATWQRLSNQFGLPPAQIIATWHLLGTRTEQILKATDHDGRAAIDDTDIPAAVVRWIIDNEWVTTLDDLVQRRLMLSYDRRLTSGCLRELAGKMSEAGRLEVAAIPGAVAATCDHLHRQFGRSVV